VFPGYLFVHITERERVAVLEKPGAMKYVSFGGQPAVLNDETIRNIRIATEQPQTFTVERERLALGQPVEVIQGPFAGMTGRLYEMRGSSRVAVQIEAIAQTLLVEVPLSLLKHL
jgi:transcription antitermination factor NusG